MYVSTKGNEIKPKIKHTNIILQFRLYKKLRNSHARIWICFFVCLRIDLEQHAGKI